MIQRLRSKFFLLFGGIGLGVALVTGVIVNMQVNDYIKKTQVNNLTSVLKVMRERYIIFSDPELLRGEFDALSNEYKYISKNVRMTAEIFDIHDIYIMTREKSGAYRFIFSLEDKDGEPFHQGAYTPPSPEFDEAWESGEIQITKAPYTNKWGTFISAALPIVQDGNTIALICADYDAKDFGKLGFLNWDSIVLSILIAFVMSAFIALFTADTFVIPIKNIVSDANELAELNFEKPITTDREDELGNIQKALEIIRGNLQKNVNWLRRARESAEMEKRKAETAQAEAEKANKAKSNFLASMSHEIRTPMNAIIGMSDLMPQDNFSDLQKRYFEDTRKMSHALLNIINDILDFSKIEAGKMELVPVNYNLKELFDNVASISQFIAAGKSLHFTSHFEEGTPEILFGDEIRVRQIFTNLVNNAIKYTKEGSVDFSIREGEASPCASAAAASAATPSAGDTPATPPDIESREWGVGSGENSDGIPTPDSRLPTPKIIATITDTGIGIKPEDMRKLFKSFQQLDAEKNKGTQGTGLGLVIAKRFAELMGGDIFVESEYGKGTTFTFVFPLVEGDPSKVHINTGEENFVIAKDPDALRVLVVDDTDINLTVAIGHLNKHNIKTETANSGQESIDMVSGAFREGRPYDLIFMDHMMPGMDGIEATHKIRSLEATLKFSLDALRPQTPVVALTANAIYGMREMFLASGMNDFISKPIVPSELNRVLGEWLPKDKIEFKTVKDEKKSAEKSAFLASLEGVIDTTAALEHLGGEDSLRVYLRQFNKDFAQYIADLRQMLSQRDLANYAVKIHALKGMFATLGNASLAAKAQSLETAAKEGREDVCVAGNEAAIAVFAEFQSKTAALMSGAENASAAASGAAAELSAEEREAALASLTKSARAGDLDGIMSARALLDGAGIAGWERVAALLDAFKFAEAAAEAQSIIDG